MKKLLALLLVVASVMNVEARAYLYAQGETLSSFTSGGNLLNPNVIGTQSGLDTFINDLQAVTRTGYTVNHNTWRMIVWASNINAFVYVKNGVLIEVDEGVTLTSDIGTAISLTDTSSWGSQVSNQNQYAENPLICFAQCTPNQYTITLNNDGGTGGAISTTATYDSAMPSISVPTRVGYTFRGYYTGIDGSGSQYYTSSGTGVKNWDIASATTLYAYWTENTYTVTLDNQGATSAGTRSVTVTYGSVMPTIMVPTKTGYTFHGYFLGGGGTGARYYNADGTSARIWDITTATSLTLYAYWTVNSYTVTLDGCGATSMGTRSVTVTYGSTMPSITVPTKTGYTFKGYYSGVDGTGARYYNAEGASVRNWDITTATSSTLYAYWTANTYTVTLNNDGWGANTTVTATYGNAMPAITLPERTGYEFRGYFTEKNGKGTQYYWSHGASAQKWDKTSATTLYAYWRAKTYTVTLDGCGATSAGSQSVTATYDSAMPAITLPKRTGYEFRGYFTEKNGKGTQYYWSHGGSAQKWNKTSAITLYAYWIKIYTVTLDNDGGSANTTVTVTYGSAMPAITLPERTGYEFSGYFTEKNGKGTQYYWSHGGSAQKWNKTSDITLYAYWIGETYTVTLNNDGWGANTTVTATYGSAMPAITLPKRTGYEFRGYFTEKNGKGTQYYWSHGGSAQKWDKTSDDIILYAYWRVNTYTVTLDNDGGSGNTTVKATYDSAVPTVSIPTKDGYTFKGYYTEKNRGGTQYIRNNGTGIGEWNIAQDTTLYAGWEINTYYITYETKGGWINGSSSSTYTVIDRVVLPKSVTKTEYEFKGWFDNEEYSGSAVAEIPEGSVGDKMFYAKWKSLWYKIRYNSNVTSIDSEEKDHLAGTSLNLPTDLFENPGYRFEGWYRTSDCSGTSIVSPVDDLRVDEEEVVDLYAKWIAIEYKLLLNSANESGVVVTNTLTYNEPANFPVNPIILGNIDSNKWENLNSNNWWGYGDYYVVGWTDKDNNVWTNGQEILNLTNEANAEVTFNAIWNYDIKFFANGGATADGITCVTQTVARGVSTNLLANTFTLHEYGFEKWTNSLGQAFFDEDNVSDIENNLKTINPTNQYATSLYACWTGVTYTAQLQIGPPEIIDNKIAYFKWESNSSTNTSTNVNLVVGIEYDLTNGYKIISDDRYKHIGWEYTSDDSKTWVKIEGNKFTPQSSDVDVIRGIWEKEPDPLAVALGAPNLEFEFAGYSLSRTTASQIGVPQYNGGWISTETNANAGTWVAVTNTDDSVYVKMLPSSVKTQNAPVVYIKTTLNGKGVFAFKYCIEGEWLYNRGTYFKFGVQTNEDKDYHYVTNLVSAVGNGGNNMSSWIDYEYVKTNDTQEVVYFQCVPIFPTGTGPSPSVGTAGVANVSWTPESPEDPDDKFTSTHGTSYSWLIKYFPDAGLTLDTSDEVMQQYEEKPTGKKDVHGNSLQYWQEYVMGTDPSDPNDVFKVVSIEMDSGKPAIKWHPNLNTNGPAQRVYTVLGSEELSTDPSKWEEMEADDYGNITKELTAPLMFFKVKVDLLP